MANSIPQNEVTTTMSSAGHIHLTLTLDHNSTISTVSISNLRPTNIEQILVGKTPQQALSLIPTIYMLCSQAQQSASLGSILKAQNTLLSEDQLHRISTGCALEWLKEHSWQLWQMERALFGDDFALQPSITVTQLLLKELNQLEKLTLSKQIEKQQPDWKTIQQNFTPLFGMTMERFLSMNMKELLLWAQSSSPYAQLFSEMLDDTVVRFGALPHWQSQNESGSIFRQKEHPLVAEAITLWGSSIATRTLTRFIEIASVCLHPQITKPTQQGEALTSRGILSHRVAIDKDGIITQYGIDAPTDRYFEPKGLMVNSLLGQTVTSMKWVRQLIWAIDPCVEFSVHVNQDTIEE